MIEKPRPEDAPTIERIARDVGFFNESEVAVVLEMFEHFFHPESRDDHTFVVYRNPDDQTLEGFACYGPAPLTERNWDLYWICVDRTRQGNGIGRRLLASIEAELRGRHARALYLETSDTPLYRPTREFYERNGYQGVATISDYYAPGDGMVIYRKILESPGP